MAESSKFPPEFPQQTVSDLVIEALTLDECLVRESYAEVLSERQWYRNISCEALATVARLTAQNRRLVAALSASRAELRECRR